MNTEIQELKTRAEWEEAYPVMHELRLHLDMGAYLALIDQMVPEGYRMFALRAEGAIVALAGIAVMTNFYHGRHVWVYDLVTAAAARSQGHGEALLRFIEEFAVAEGCVNVALASGVQRVDAHRFYEGRMGYERASWCFVKGLTGA